MGRAVGCVWDPALCRGTLIYLFILIFYYLGIFSWRGKSGVLGAAAVWVNGGGGSGAGGGQVGQGFGSAPGWVLGKGTVPTGLPCCTPWRSPRCAARTPRDSLQTPSIAGFVWMGVIASPLGSACLLSLTRPATPVKPGSMSPVSEQL